MKLHIIIALLLTSISTALWSQNEDVVSKKAYQEYKAISDTMSSSFPEDNIKTYRRESFNDQQLQTYLGRHFRRLDLLPQIKGRPLFVLDSYLHSGNWFREIGFPKESIGFLRNP